MKIYIFPVIALLLISLGANAQTVSFENKTAQPTGYTTVVVTASGFPSNVAAVTIYIGVDANVAQCIGSIPGVLPGANVSQASNNRIGIVWTGGGGGYNINGTLCTLIMHYNCGSTVLDGIEGIDTMSIVTPLFEEIPYTYINGSVSAGIYTINTYYVDAARPSSGDGLSWGTAKKTIQEAANLSLKPGEQVLIKPGTYAETVTIKSNGGYLLRPTTGVVLSDNNKITFPSGAVLPCIDLVNYPGQYYAYIYRSWVSNNGYYKITEVNTGSNFIRVDGASFIPESGTVNNYGKVMAAIGRPIIFKKDPAASESQRVVVNTTTLGTIADAFYVGTPISPDFTADSANWHIFEGIDITGGNGTKGLHIQCSSQNVFAKGKIYSSGTSGTNNLGVIISGNSSRGARFNIIQNNEIYNTPYQGILIGYTNNSASYNFSHNNHVLDNNMYITGSTFSARFNNAVKIQQFNKNNVIEGNNFHDIPIYTAGEAAVAVVTKADSTLIYNNIFRNIGKSASNSGVNAAIMLDSTIYKAHVYNNIIYNDDTVTNAVYAFRVYGRRHVGSKLAFNTVYKIDNAFYLQDNNANGAAIDFGIHNNIISPTVGYFNNVGTTGRFTVTYNLFRISPGTPYASGTGNIFGDPLFIDPNGSSMYGLMLTPTSPAMDTGTVITNLTRDYIGDLRGSPEPTLGAFENTMTATWNGSVSTDWNNVNNWTYKILPKNYSPVVIPNVTNDPVVSTGNATCNSISLSPGATLRVSPPRTLTVNY
ncbi:MAG TPA: hypothetical protein PLW31_02065 [Bacteroidales bacterium]|nr:hypothetical protein [Bacteroidales bacterium]HPI86442.1 hypothetical protein [Bacteroidales bacterium]